MPNQNPDSNGDQTTPQLPTLYKLPLQQAQLTEDDVLNIASNVVRNFQQPAKLAGGYFQSTNFVTGVSGWQLTPTSAEFNVGVAVLSINIPDSTTANSFHVDTAGNAWWGTNVATGSASAPAKVLNTGAATFTSVTITGGAISGTPISSIPNNSSTDISLLTYTHSLVFTSASNTQINWAAGTITMSNGRTFSISSGNTGTMAALTYVYLDTGTSSTVLQTTTTLATASGANKILIAAAQNNTAGASVISYGGGQPLINGQVQITAASILTGQIAANTIVGGNISTLNISGKSATFDTGTIAAFTMASNTLSATNLTLTSGAANTANIAVGTGSNLAGMNSGNAGSDIAFWSGNTFANRATAPFRVDLAGNLTATSATLSGYTVATSGTFGGDGSDGALTLTSGTTTLSFSSTTFLVKNYSSISITSTGKLAFSNPATQGSAAIIKSQGAITLTASATIIDMSGMGAVGATGVTNTANTNGNNGNNGAVVVFQSNAGAGPVAPSSTAAGGSATINSVLYPSSFSQHLNRYPLALVGSSGGSGCINGNGTSSTSGPGGRGGGCLIIECGGAWNFTTANGISVAGANGGDGSGPGTSGAGGGGGGSGGFLLALYKTLTANSGTVVTSGGTGGNSFGPTTTSGGGGGGLLTAGGTSTTGSNGSKNGADGAVGISTITTNQVFA